MNAPAVIALPLSSYENMKMELAWRHENLIKQIRKIRTNLKDIRIALKPNQSPKTTNHFDPLRTIGKYC